MSDSAPLNQQQNLSKMQSPGTVGRTVPSASVTPQTTTSSMQPTVAEQVVGTSDSVPQNISSSSSVSKVDPIVQPVPPVPVAQSTNVADPMIQSSSSQQSDGQLKSSPIPTSPIAPISAPSSATPHKESGPISVLAPSVESAKPVEIVRQSTPEVSVPPEVKEVISVSEEAKPIKVDPQLKNAGVTLAAESTPIAHTPTGDVKLPMTYADALATEKKTKFWSAVHWFAAFIVYQWRKLDPSLKN